MIRRDPELHDNIFELSRHETIGDYARAYGDRIAQAYEDLNLIYFPYFPLKFDWDFWRVLKLPKSAKKIGTTNGIDRSLYVRKDDSVSFDGSHILLQIFPGQAVAGYMQGEMADVNGQIRTALATLFPKYYSLQQSNITWRMTLTENEVMHLDSFLGGKPTPPGAKIAHRIKLFINIDSQPRKWRISYPLPEILKRYRDKLPAALPDDADQVSYTIGVGNFLNDAPYHEIDIPPMGAVAGEAGVLAHQIVYGKRVIAAEFFCESRDMLAPEKNTHASIAKWLTAAGIPIDTSGQLAAPVGQDIYAKA
jgi:hypothetical protein